MVAETRRINRTQIYPLPEQHKALLKEAAKRGISFAALMREIVANHLEKSKTVKNHPEEVYMRLVGLGQSGARDVSEHHECYLAEALKNDYHG